MTPTPHDVAATYGENALVEAPAIALLESLGWKTANLYHDVGAALTAWAIMEEAMIPIMSYLLITDPTKAGIILYSTVNFQVWINMLDELFAIEDRYAPLKSKWYKLGARLRGLKDNRDRLAHHAATMGEQASMFEISLRPSIMDLRAKSRKYEPMTREDILRFRTLVSDLTRDLLSLGREMTAMFEALQEKSPE